MTLPRSTQAGRGQLAGPARSARQVRTVTIQVAEVEPGVLRLSQPVTPGWIGDARNPTELARLVASAFVEAQIAAHATWRGEPYEATDGTLYRRPPRGRSRAPHRSDTYDPREWRVNADGRWIAPGTGRSRLWSPDSLVVRQVQRRRVAMGLPAVPDMTGDIPGVDHG